MEAAKYKVSEATLSRLAEQLHKYYPNEDTAKKLNHVFMSSAIEVLPANGRCPSRPALLAGQPRTSGDQQSDQPVQAQAREVYTG